jgi:hypothetical protein
MLPAFRVSLSLAAHSKALSVETVPRHQPVPRSGLKVGDPIGSPRPGQGPFVWPCRQPCRKYSPDCSLGLQELRQGSISSRKQAVKAFAFLWLSCDRPWPCLQCDSNKSCDLADGLNRRSKGTFAGSHERPRKAQWARMKCAQGGFRKFPFCNTL